MKKNQRDTFRYRKSILRIILAMKFIVFCLFLGILQVSVNGYSQMASINLVAIEIELNEVIRDIQSQTEFNFFYSPTDLDGIKISSESIEDLNLDDALDILLSGTGLEYEIVHKSVIIRKEKEQEAKPMEVKLLDEPEKKFIQGKVFDSKGELIPGVSVLVKGTTIGTVTDATGEFKLKVPVEAKTFVISFIGMKTIETNIGNKEYFEFTMVDDVVGLDDVVIVGYGIQKKESVTGAIGQLTKDDLVRMPVVNISNALVGQIAGLAAVQKTGEAGFEETTIRIRGVGTYTGDQNPLIVIDGIIRDQASFNMLDPYDVEGINVLKDASATAVYGVRGANGVIIVTTKRGQQGRVKVSLTTNFGLTTPSTLANLVNSSDYAILRNEAYINDGKTTNPKVFNEDELWKFSNNRDYTPEEVESMSNLDEAQKEALLNSPAVYYNSTDYMNQIFGNMVAPQQQYNINISGGTDKVSYFTSVGYTNQRSLTNDFSIANAPSNSGSKKNNFRTNFDFKMIKNTEINVSISGQVRNTSVITDRNGDAGIGGRYRDLMLNVFEAPPYSGQGVYDGRIISDYAGGTIMASNKGAWGRTPIAYMMQKSQARINQSSLSTSIRAKHDASYLLKGLSFRGAVSYNHYFTKTLLASSNLPTYTYTRNPINPAELLFYGGEENPTYYSESGWNKNRKFYVEGGVDYNNEFGKHKITAMALITAERYTAAWLTYNVPQGYYGIVGRTTYSYDDRYLAELNMGYNGSENFAPGKRFGFFPSVSAGWIVSNEPYFPKNDFLTLLKFRGSYGQTGNSNIGGNRFLFLPGTWDSRGFGLYSGNPLQGYYFGSSNGTTNNTAFAGRYEKSVGNPDVTWEKKESYNIALETRFFKDRLSFVADLFHEVRDNILTTLGTTPGIIGVSTSALPPVNVGSMSNMGYELQSNWRDEINNEFFYRIGAQVSYAMNKIEYMAEPSYAYDWMNSTGFSYGQYKAMYDEGFYNSAEEVANHPYNDVDANKVQAGDLRIVDVNGDGLINTEDETPTGFSNVPRYTFSGNISAGYKGFEVSALFTGSAQGTFWMNGYLITPFSQGSSTPLEYMTGRWTAETYAAGNEITFPRMAVNLANSQNASNNSFWYRSTDHVKLKNVEVSYSFKSMKFLNNIPIESIRVFVNANNLYTWGGKNLIDGIDPELIQDRFSSEGIIYPLTCIYNFGLNIQF